MNQDTLNDLWIGAFRYYLGRMTISVHAFCDSLINEYASIPDQAKNVIRRELRKAIEQDDEERTRRVEEGDHVRAYQVLGHGMDRYKWLQVMQVFDINQAA